MWYTDLQIAFDPMDNDFQSLPRERGKARYKAHCTRMTAHKARQQLRRRKYRGGANAGWY